MMVNWERIAEQSQGLYQSADYEQAAYRLMVEQVVYATDRGSRLTYDLVAKHLAQYRDLFERFGMEIQHNHFHSYIVAIPTHRVAPKMRLAETRHALVLRRLYDDKMHAAEVDAGEAFISLEELERAYKELLDRDLPERGELRELMASMKRFGIGRLEDLEEGQPFQIIVRPGIVEVLGETALLQLASHAPELDTEVSDETA